MNRNGELRQVFTYSTAGGNKVIQRGAYLNRRYLKFKVPAFVPTWTGHTPDLFLTNLATVGQGKSAKGGAHDSDGTETTGTPNTLTDNDARFLEWGVATGDTLWLRRGSHTYGPFTISGVNLTQVKFTGASFGNNQTYIKYHIRRAAPRGECLVDDWYGGGSYLRNGGGCKGISFWQAMGPIPSGATSVTVTIPNITPGAQPPSTAYAGTVPDFWEGIPSDPRWNNAWYHPPKLAWSISS